jgi:ATP-independent RNA helicase DbpA
VFCNFKRTVAETAAILADEGFDVAALHGDLEQPDRERVLATFRCGAARVLVATDVAARGLDIDGLDMVINAELPQQTDIYVHRIGRTGRAGRAGEAWSLVTAAQRGRLTEISATSAPVTVHESLELEDGPPLSAAWRVLRLGSGRKDKLRRGDVLGALTGDCGLAGDQVGRIDVLDRQAFVAVATDAAEEAFKGISKHGIKGRRIRVERVR